jgi:hypothetical protein
MSEYAMCECYNCSRLVPRAEAHRETIEIESGRSSGGFGIGDNFGIFYSGQTYYTKEEIWLCHDCYQARSRRRRIPVIAGVAILLIAILPGVFSRGTSTNAAKPHAVADSSVHADRTAAVAPLQGANKLSPPPSDIMAAQNRLIELGFLKGPADDQQTAAEQPAPQKPEIFPLVVMFRPKHRERLTQQQRALGALGKCALRAHFELLESASRNRCQF